MPVAASIASKLARMLEADSAAMCDDAPSPPSTVIWPTLSKPRANSVIIGTSASSARWASSASWFLDSASASASIAAARASPTRRTDSASAWARRRVASASCAAIWARASAAFTSP